MPAKNPPGGFTKNDPRINRSGRPKVGLSMAEKIRDIAGDEGNKLLDMWFAVSIGRLPKVDESQSSNALYITRLIQLQQQATVKDRIVCSQLLAERGWGKPKEVIEHSGSVNLPTQVVHEYHSS